MNRDDFPFVKIPKKLADMVGEPDTGTRMYRRIADDVWYREWFLAVSKICSPDGMVSPGGAGMYARVSRAGVHKRMKEGRITAFLFHVVKGETRWTKKEILDHGGRPYIYIPAREVEAWGEIISKRMTPDEARKEILGDGDERGSFLTAKGRKVRRAKKT